MGKIAIAGLTLLIVATSGCTFFTAYDPITGHKIITTTGAPLLSRKETFEITRTWLDDDNNLTELKITRNTDENASAQMQVLQALIAAQGQGASPIR